MEDSTRDSAVEPKSNRENATPSPFLPVLLLNSSSSSSLLLPENKNDSPTKSSRLSRSRSSGSLRKSPRGSGSSTPVAAILDSLKVAEEEKMQAQQQGADTTLENTSPKDVPPDETMPTRPQQRASPPTMITEEETMQQLERICASPLSIDSRNTTDISDTEEQPSPSNNKKKMLPPPRLLSPASKTASLQWHEAGPQTTSRVLPARGPNKLLPSPPSMRISATQQQQQDEDDALNHNTDEVVAVFNANTSEGKSMVRALAKSGSQVVAIVRVFTSRNTKSLLQLGQNVVVKVADSHDEAALAKAVQGAHRAFMCTTYWDRFDSPLEEKQALLVLEACASQQVQHLVLSSFEDTKMLRLKGLKSQIVPNQNGSLTPNFDGMKSLQAAAKERHVMLTHMVTSYLDQEHSKKSLCLIVGPNGHLLVNSYIPLEEKNQLTPTVE